TAIARPRRGAWVSARVRCATSSRVCARPESRFAVDRRLAMSSSLQVDAVLAQIRAMQSQIRGAAAPANQAAKVAAGAGLGPHKTTQVPGTPSFAAVMKQGIEHVNQAQQRAGQLAAQFE